MNACQTDRDGSKYHSQPLRNLNPPKAGSHVNLNSAHASYLMEEYPNFNSAIWGRVNFITNIRYAEKHSSRAGLPLIRMRWKHFDW